MEAPLKTEDALPISSDALLERLTAWELPFELHEHPPLRTVEDAKSVEAAMTVPGEQALRIKNLYLRDKKKRNYLVTLEQDREIDLKALGAALGVGNLSFGSADRLFEVLGVRPGAVTPLAMINGVEKGVRFFMDSAFHEVDRVYMHPLVNDRTIAMSRGDVMRFFEQIGVEPEWVE
ncbi:prolyl-tRNA synthetase associated domain-containing protein [Shimia aestuarii]|uniref:Ala-tRNA(Pro) deacylase n=1 Tax=Shimia aestuarii TaxID=254406 RepID=A0A1I4I950_9RHOB|nr:prolyl-tRNA synthetase associated domain-containing protein [Shimia aestuarii]SFL50929.1 Ala-tRNA(Pro) deacylase [Shimia aestuarii]